MAKLELELGEPNATASADELLAEQAAATAVAVAVAVAAGALRRATSCSATCRAPGW